MEEAESGESEADGAFKVDSAGAPVSPRISAPNPDDFRRGRAILCYAAQCAELVSRVMEEVGRGLEGWSSTR